MRTSPYNETLFRRRLQQRLGLPALAITLLFLLSPRLGMAATSLATQPGEDDFGEEDDGGFDPGGEDDDGGDGFDPGGGGGDDDGDFDPGDGEDDDGGDGFDPGGGGGDDGDGGFDPGDGEEDDGGNGFDPGGGEEDDGDADLDPAGAEEDDGDDGDDGDEGDLDIVEDGGDDDGDGDLDPVEDGGDDDGDLDPEEDGSERDINDGDLDEGDFDFAADEDVLDEDFEFVDDDAYYDPFAEDLLEGEDGGEDLEAWWDEDEDLEAELDEEYFDPYDYEAEGDDTDLMELLDGASEEQLDDLSDEELEALADLIELDQDVGEGLPEEDRIEPNAAINLFRKALRDACPQTELAALEACLQSDAVKSAVSGMSKGAVAQWLLGGMDIDLPVGLGKQRIEDIAGRCSAEGDAWSGWVASRLGGHVQECSKNTDVDWDDCVIEQSLSDIDPESRQERFAQCMVEDPVVTTVYLSIQRKKKKAFHPKLYLHYRGLMGSFTVKKLKAMRAKCGEGKTSLDELRKCFQRYPEVAAELNEVAALADMVTDALSSGEDEKATARFKARFSKLFLTLPELSIEILGAGCGAQELPASIEAAEKVLTCIEDSARQNPLANPAFISTDRLAEWYPKVRTAIIDRLRAKEEASLSRAFGYIWKFLAGLAALGFIGILLMPLGLRSKYPNVPAAQMWKSSVIAAFTFVITIGLLGVTLLVTKSVQGGFMIENTSPKLVVVNGLFDVLEREESRKRFSEMSAAHLDFIRTPLQEVIDEVESNRDAVAAKAKEVGTEAAAAGKEAVEAGKELAKGDLRRYEAFAAYISSHWAKQLREPEIQLYLDRLAETKSAVESSKIVYNARLVQEQVGVYQSIFDAYRRVDWVMGYVPIVMSIIAVILYLLPLRETLVTIAMAPVHAAQGGGEGIVARATKTITAELKVLLPYLGIAFGVIFVTGFFLALAIEPFIEVLMNYTLLRVFYILLADASPWVLYGTLGGALLLVVMCLAVYLAAAISFLGTTHKILRARFHEGQSFRDVGSLWLRGGVAVIWILVVPWLYGTLIILVMGNTGDHTAVPSPSDLVLVPLVALLLMPAALWAVRVLRALAYVRKVPKLAAAQSNGAAAAEPPAQG
ncbi:MAG: hypothetical protein AAF799_28410 [Myxococcota bacterium]